MSAKQEASVAACRATRREWIGLAGIALPCLLYSMDLTVLFLAMPHLGADLRPSSTQLLWITDIYGFLLAGSLVTMGTLGDRIGRRRLLLAGAAAFSVTSILAAFATSPGLIGPARWGSPRQRWRPPPCRCSAPCFWTKAAHDLPGNQEYGPEVGWSPDTARRQRLLGELDALRTDRDPAWRSAGIDVLVCAAHTLPALLYGQSGMLGPANAGSYATLFDVTGHPADAEEALT
jgi:Major Facilitator Superfamily